MNQKIITALSLFLGIKSAIGQWNPNTKENNPVVLVSKKGNAQINSLISVSDNMGGMYIAWIENRNTATANDIFLTHLLATGVADPDFPEEGKSICKAIGAQSNLTMAEDGNGGAVLTWTDPRNNAISSNDIYAQRVDKSGKIVWAENGVPISQRSTNETGPVLARISSTQMAIAWRFFANSLDLALNYINLADGSKALATDVQVVNLSNNQTNQKLVADGKEGCILVWTDGRNGNSSSGIFSQRFNKSGDPLWAASGVAIRTASGSNTTAPQIVNDGKEGAVITWSDNRNGPTNADIYIQRINGNGEALWAAEGVQATKATGQQLLPTLIKSNNQYIVSWNDGQNGATNIDIYAQAFSENGNTLWNAGNPLAVVTEAGNQPNVNNAPIMITDGLGGAFAVWDDRRNGAGDDDIYSQYINASGTIIWPTMGNPISIIAGSNQTSPVAVEGQNGSIVVSWRDSRSSVTFGELYASNVQRTGLLPLQFLQVAAQVKNKLVTIHFTTANSFNVETFDIEKSLNSREFKTIGTVAAYNTPANKNYSYSDTDKAEGSFYYRIKANDKDGTMQISKVVKASIASTNGENVSIFPNPVNNILHIETIKLETGSYTFSLIDLSGKNRLNTRFIQSQNRQSVFSINIQNITHGIYKFQVIDEKGQVVLSKNLMKK